MSPACVQRPTAPRLTDTASGQNYGKGRASVGNDDIDHYLGPLTKECGRESIYMTAITSSDVHFFGYSMRTDSWRLTVWLPWDHVQVIGRWDKLVESQGVSRGWVETCGCPKACQTHWEGNCSDPTAGIAALLWLGVAGLWPNESCGRAASGAGDRAVRPTQRHRPRL